MYVILLGLPGAGKGTQAARLKDETGLAHITTGELFRENIRQGTKLGEEARPYVEGGLLVPNELTIGMLLDRISQPDAAKGFMLDGFPRNLEQAKALDEALVKEGKKIDRAVYIKVSSDELVRRLAGRWNCPQCSEVYNETSRPPEVTGVCDNCGSLLYQREDDKPETVRKRIEVNLEQMAPLTDYYRTKGVLAEVNGERDIDEITRDMKSILAS